MKKRSGIVALLLAMMVMSAGCLSMVGKKDETTKKKHETTTKKTEKVEAEDTEDTDEPEETKKSGKNSSSATTEEKEFGSYTLDGDWIEAEKQSVPPEIFVYCLKGNEDSKTPPNNIVVRYGTNDYTKEQHEDFCTAILVQVKQQAASYGGDAHMDGFGEINGCMCYRFVLDCDPYTIQWYFCGEKEFVMVGMSIYDQEAAKEDRIEEVAQQIVDSFEWDR